MSRITTIALAAVVSIALSAMSILPLRVPVRLIHYPPGTAMKRAWPEPVGGTVGRIELQPRHPRVTERWSWLLS